MSIVVTGASGTIGTALTQAMTADGIGVWMLDIRAPARVPDGARALQVDLRDLDAVIAASTGADAIVHLAGISHEAPLAELCQHNIAATHHVLEAARRNNITRVVLASSHHTVGFYPIGQQVRHGDPPAPDSFYAVSKIAAEALGSLYANKYGLQVVAVRIGSFQEQPIQPRHAATWLSPTDATNLLTAAATAPLGDWCFSWGLAVGSVAVAG